MKRAAVFLVWLAACGAKSEPASQFPARESGCNIELFHDAPTRPTVNIGPVTARCDESVTAEDCLRTLKDEACKLGGDIVWGVPDEPVRRGGKQQWSGRAAHSK